MKSYTLTFKTVLDLFVLLFISYSWILLMGEIETFGELNLGRDYFEGDMKLTQEQRNSIRTYWQDDNPQSRNLTPSSFRQLWPNNTVPYTLTRMRKWN